MAERTTGLRRALASPAVYSWAQNLLGARAVRGHVLSRHLRLAPGERLLDLGCGPGQVLELLPQVEYLGVDRDSAYIDAARARGDARAEFVCSDVLTVELPPRSFDAVLAIGLLHHLDDEDAARVFEVAAQALAENGRMVTVDPALAPGQPAIARWLITRDRGRDVRAPAELEALARAAFGRVAVDCRHDLARVPYTHAVLKCAEPRS
jgi:SAM-dependent methyltransferase